MPHTLMTWSPLKTFQCNIAKRWKQRGDASSDIFSKFFFYFAGFNALYFLWSRIDDVRNKQGEPAGEEKQIHNLLAKFSRTQAARILELSAGTVTYFTKRRPIQRMDRRNQESPVVGEDAEGRKWRRRLAEEESPSEKLKALGSILYLIRSNLVHGSKAASGDDEEIITLSVPVLQCIVKESISITERAFRSKEL